MLRKKVLRVAESLKRMRILSRTEILLLIPAEVLTAIQVWSPAERRIVTAIQAAILLRKVTLWMPPQKLRPKNLIQKPHFLRSFFYPFQVWIL